MSLVRTVLSEASNFGYTALITYYGLHAVELIQAQVQARRTPAASLHPANYAMPADAKVASSLTMAVIGLVGPRVIRRTVR